MAGERVMTDIIRKQKKKCIAYYRVHHANSSLLCYTQFQTNIVLPILIMNIVILTTVSVI